MRDVNNFGKKKINWDEFKTFHDFAEYEILQSLKIAIQKNIPITQVN